MNDLFANSSDHSGYKTVNVNFLDLTQAMVPFCSLLGTLIGTIALRSYIHRAGFKL